MNHKQTYLDSLRSPLTRKAYDKDIELFEAFIGKDALKAVDADAFKYKAHLKGLNLAPLTVNRRIASIRSYFEFLKAVRLVPFNPFDAVKAESSANFDATDSFSNEEVVAVLGQKMPIRDLCILEMLFFLGLRKSEVASIKLKDLRLSLQNPTVSVLGKGDKVRELTLPESLANHLSEYVAYAHAHILREAKSEWLFQGEKKDSHLHHNSITKLVENYSRKAGITRKVSPHMCRVTAVSSALSNGAPLEMVKEMGGWNSLDMVLRYDRRVKSLKQSAVFSVNYGVKK